MSDKVSVFLPSSNEDNVNDVLNGISSVIELVTGWTPRKSADEIEDDAASRGLDLKGDGKLWRITIEEVVDAEVAE